MSPAVDDNASSPQAPASWSDASPADHGLSKRPKSSAGGMPATFVFRGHAPTSKHVQSMRLGGQYRKTMPKAVDRQSPSTTRAPPARPTR
ncbi:hypothetical protein MKEN_00388800 [Mycena kentingensis (nom. inval.)]|nr:hypothetical protein MKEN_00388800 [Mycena kentingensis (nom. inval.)]